ncbi:uncharacterized protein G2W53_014674 [Senna tora]|uniref:Uncharacterized protein n=1 Tax=Senna tora TaxID=362788 RepID=A0A834WTX0_9FABA|nr:uncharacterized protein G2W53_014674 [Senna tora]
MDGESRAEILGAQFAFGNDELGSQNLL